MKNRPRPADLPSAEDDATRMRARISAKLEKVESVMGGKRPACRRDLDRGESIRAPTQRHKLVHVAVAVRLSVARYRIARRRLLFDR